MTYSVLKVPLNPNQPTNQLMGWQWPQLDHMQIICTLLQTDNHASTSQNRDGRQLMPGHVRSQYVQNNSAGDN